MRGFLRQMLALAALFQSAQTPVIKSGVDLVVVDVHVVDRSGQPVVNLGPDDFEVSIDRGRRKVVSADLVQYSTDSGTFSSPAGAGSAAAAAMLPAAARRFILAIDEHSFRPASARAAMRAASGFVDQLLPTDLVGLYTYPTGAAQSDLTTDHSAVRSKLEKVVGQLDVPLTRYNLSKSEVIDVASGDREALNRVVARECRSEPGCSRAIYGEALSLAALFEMQVTQSLGGLRQLFEGLTTLEGRKTVVLISGGLFTSDRGDGRVRMQTDIAQIGRQAALSNTNLYVLHMDSSFIDAFSERRGPNLTIFRDSNQLATGLEIVSGAAGGALFRVQAGTGENAFKRVIRENSAYFLLGVEPDPKDRDGSPHSIQVRVRTRGVTVRHRAVVTVPKSDVTSGR
jgi:VWFA-related protein